MIVLYIKVIFFGQGVGIQSKAKAKQRCVMGVGMCLYAQLVQTKNK